MRVSGVCWAAIASTCPRAFPPVLSADDPLSLSTMRDRMRESLALESTPSEASDLLCRCWEESLAPLEPAVYQTEGFTREDRIAAIRDLSLCLDGIEAAAVGPLLAGPRPHEADALLFPSLVLLENTLPVHFGWEAWSDEALFWRRPRLHAFFELIKYEPVAREVERSVIARLNDLDVDWSSIAVEVPTSNLRKIPRN